MASNNLVVAVAFALALLTITGECLFFDSPCCGLYSSRCCWKHRKFIATEDPTRKATTSQGWPKVFEGLKPNLQVGP